MAFSLRTLLIAVLLIAVIAAALIYQNRMWAVAIVNVTIALLVVGTLGLWIGQFNRAFWIPFCFVGWLYLAIAFTDADINRLVTLLPGTQVSWLIWNRSLDTPSGNGLTIGADGTLNWLTTVPDSQEISRYLDFLNIMQSLFTLLTAGLAGRVASFFLGRTRQRSK